MAPRYNRTLSGTGKTTGRSQLDIPAGSRSARVPAPGSVINPYNMVRSTCDARANVVSTY
jgi:hypothetical protein